MTTLTTLSAVALANAAQNSKTKPKRRVPTKKRSTLVDANEFLNEFLSNNQDIESSLPEARKWLADELYAHTPPTLATLRLRAGLTQSQLAQRTEQPQPSVSRLESGKETPSIDRAKRFADALGVTLDQYYVAFENTRQGKA